MKLESGETITYTYDQDDRIISEVSSTGETVTTTYTDTGQVQTLTNANGTTTYHYDSTGSLTGIDAPNGSQIRYQRDILGRVTQMTERASATAEDAITRYSYDGAGNLIGVIDPNQGETVMTYNAVNRLSTRTLPNGVTTTYTYDLTDQIQTITHAAADGGVLSSYTYDRNDSGEPSRITREDGSYRELTYDASLRLTSEAFYDATGTEDETITYTYDGDGKRIARSDGNGTGNYTYDDGFQLTSIESATETQSYEHDEDGRLQGLTRDGETVDLNHNAKDQLTLVTNAATGETVTYFYDGEGNRIGERTGSEVKQYLVAPSMGSGLSVPDLIADEEGNVLANHVYGGTTPLMRLDSNGNAVYYLTDAMGSVIGLVDENGEEVAGFEYDGFGNLRGGSGSDGVGDELGGDFRFQSQWLESESGLYYFRARDYDARTGRFLSRDPVDRIETEPESFNPYQFVYNNPYVYSDPTGEITISELNASGQIQSILNSINQSLSNSIRQEIIDEVRSITTDIVTSLLKNVVPGADRSNHTLNGKLLSGTPSPWEEAVTGSICDTIRDAMPQFFGLDYLWFQPSLSNNGDPEEDGFNPASEGSGCGIPFSQNSKGLVQPELIIKRGGLARQKKSPKGSAVLEVKTSIDSVEIQSRQTQAILKYASPAKGYLHLPIAIYISLWGAKASKKKNKEIELQKAAFKKYGVILQVIDFGS